MDRRNRFALALGMTLLLTPLSAAQQASSVDLTVHETFSRTRGEVVRGHFDGCERVSIRTLQSGKSQRGGVATFTGSKRIDCGSGDTITLAFKVKTSECSKTNTGTWQVTRGTGQFESARGQGKLVGTYTYGDETGTFCHADGVNDRYTGELQY